MKRRWIIIPMLLLGAVTVWWFRTPAMPAARLEPFLKNVQLLDLSHDARPLQAENQLEYERGIYVAVQMTPVASIPKKWQDHDVREVEHWPMIARIFPAREGPRSKRKVGAICFPARSGPPRPHRVAPADMTIHVRGANSYLHQTRLGFEGTPRNLPDEQNGVVTHWTFLAVTAPQLPGDYTIEVTIYPAARWISSVRSESGPEFLIWRGRLHVPDPERTSRPS